MAKKYIITEKQLRKLNNQHGEIIAHEGGFAYHYPHQQNRRIQPLELQCEKDCDCSCANDRT